MKKRIASIIISAVLILASVPFANASVSDTVLYDFYGDNMIFKQNEEAVFAGTGTAGSLISATLYNGEAVVASGEDTVSADGTFTVSFDAPQGGYTEYTVILTADGTEFAKLENVVFGELWISNGQSNMMYPLGQDKHGIEMAANGEKGSKWLRVLRTPAYPEYKGSSELLPAYPQNNIYDAFWITGESEHIYGSSAVGYYFASQLIEKLDMPVGILDISLGGSSIASWISRDALETAPELKAALTEYGNYVSPEDWEEDNQNIYTNIATNYNLKTYALRHFRVSGMIWYQGESDISWQGEDYERAFDLMQDSYTELFEYEGEKMPLIFTQLAAYFYDDEGYLVNDRNMVFADMQASRPDSRAMTTISDLPLTFLPECGLIHPEHKKEIGERMAVCAENLVYGDGCYTAAMLESSEIRDGSVYATIRNTGDGLAFDGILSNGFAVCGEDGVYVRANAEIVSEDTVRIWSVDVPDPVSATYAYSPMNVDANLYSSLDGQLFMPVSQFITNPDVGTHYWIEKPWADCNQATFWHQDNEKRSGYYNCWESDDAVIAFENNGSFRITSQSDEFTVSPPLTYKDGIVEKAIADVETDYSDYGEIRLYVRNNGTQDAELKEFRLVKNSVTYYSPEANGTLDVEAVIPADGEWHCITLNLNKLYLNANEGGFAYPNSRLDGVTDFEIVFGGENADISLGGMEFTPSAQDDGISFDADIANADTFFEKLSAVFTMIIGAIVNIFR